MAEPSSSPSPVTHPTSTRRTVAVAITVVLLLAVVGVVLREASGATHSSTSVAKGTNQRIILYWNAGGGNGESDITTMDPGMAQDASTLPIVDQVFDQLVTLDANLEPELWGADHLTISPDGMTYTFHLRPHQKFSDGTPVKASDYAFALNRAASPCLASPTGGYLAPLKDAATFIGETCNQDGHTVAGAIKTLIGDSIIADDSADTFALHLASPAGYFEEALSAPTAAPIEASVLGDDVGAHGKWTDQLTSDRGNSGMFNVKSWDHAGTLDLVPNPDWWGVAAGKTINFTEVDYKIFEDGDALYRAYQSDPTAAFAFAIPQLQVAAAKGDADFKTSPILETGGLEFNYKIKPFDNKDARLAFCEAIDRDLVSTTITKGATQPSWHIVPRGMPGYTPNLQGPDGVPTSGDLAKAQAHWAAYKATLHGAPVPPISLLYIGASATVAATDKYYQSTWDAAFGVDVTFTTPFGTILQEEDNTTYQLFRFGWLADYPDPQDFLTLLFDTRGPYNEAHISVPAADALMEAADTMFLPSQQGQRLQLYNQAEQLLLDDGAFCPVSAYTNSYALRPWVHGLSEDAQGAFPNDQWVDGYLTSAEPSAR